MAGGTPHRTAPYPQWPQAGSEELEALKQVLRSGAWSSTYGTQVTAFEQRFAAFHEAKHGVCVSSGEAGLVLALQALEVPPGGQVIVPAYSFVAAATAVLKAGGVPVFADVDPETYCLDPDSTASLIGSDTVGIMPVHFAGLATDMVPISRLAEQHGLFVLEDAAQAWGARYRDRPVGVLGDASAFSFQASKNITAGEGGIILTNGDQIAARCRSLADCGRASPDQRHRHTLLGGNYRMTEFQGAVLCAQLERYPRMLKMRACNAVKLREEIAQVPGVTPLTLPDKRTHAWHLVVVRIDPEVFGGIPKSLLVKVLSAEGVPVSAGYSAPPYAQPLFDDAERVPHRRAPCPVAERACASEAVWIRQQALLGSDEDALDVAQAFAKVQLNHEEMKWLLD